MQLVPQSRWDTAAELTASKTQTCEIDKVAKLRRILLTEVTLGPMKPTVEYASSVSRLLDQLSISFS